MATASRSLTWTGVGSTVSSSCRPRQSGGRRLNRRSRPPPLCGPGGDAVGLEELLQLAGLGHLANDIAAADELTLDIELRDGRPAREFLDALADLGVGQDVDALELDTELAEDLDDRGREAALREDRRSLHIEDHRITGHILLDALKDDIVCHFNFLAANTDKN